MDAPNASVAITGRALNGCAHFRYWKIAILNSKNIEYEWFCFIVIVKNLTHALEFAGSHAFNGIIWNTLADASNPRLFLEVRDIGEKRVTFSALNLQNNQWLWKDVGFEEPWWVSLAAVSGDILLLTMYTDTSNPDKKSIIAYDVSTKEIRWWKNGFACSAADTRFVKGTESKFSGKEIILDLFTGQPADPADFDLGILQNFPVIRPFQYEQGTPHFETVRHFLTSALGIVPVISIEYLEVEMLIVASVFVKEEDLANYLYVFASDGAVLLKEILGQGLKGVGLDTFFIFSGHLIFVKNKHELIRYRIV
jgi:hypothetical protein